VGALAKEASISRTQRGQNAGAGSAGGDGGSGPPQRVQIPPFVMMPSGPSADPDLKVVSLKPHDSFKLATEDTESTEKSCPFPDPDTENRLCVLRVFGG
jgi:hypothetical protein